jgi:uroporphyrin-III C-methyltransferase/precorrin-2 dehydrogenase/sirohydrochlorin ferrochelatase
MMGYIPLFLNVQDAACLVVGGGQTALRKAVMLLEAGARVEAVSPQFNAAFDDLQSRYGKALALRHEVYSGGDLSAFQLVFAATNRHGLNRSIAEDARRCGIWVNVVDEPELCSAICGAVLNRGPLQIAVSTGGACPTLAVALRDELGERYPDWTGVFASVLGSLRGWLLERCPEMETRKRVLYRLASVENRDRHAGLEPEALLLKLQAEVEQMLRELGVTHTDGDA